MMMNPKYESAYSLDRHLGRGEASRRELRTESRARAEVRGAESRGKREGKGLRVCSRFYSPHPHRPVHLRYESHFMPLRRVRRVDLA